MRSSGILMHLSSLPSPYGIGNMGKVARDFADFLSLAGQKYWQLLPICPTGYGDSPYQSYSTNAGNPYFIDLDTLCEEGLLTKAEIEEHFWGDDEEKVDYGALYAGRYPVLKKAAARFWQKPDKEFDSFCEKNAFWLMTMPCLWLLKRTLAAHLGTTGKHQSATAKQQHLQQQRKSTLKKSNSGKQCSTSSLNSGTAFLAM